MIVCGDNETWSYSDYARFDGVMVATSVEHAAAAGSVHHFTVGGSSLMIDG